MKESDALYATEKLAHLKSKFQVNVIPDWGYGEETAGGPWQDGSWLKHELDRLQDTVELFSNTLGGNGYFAQQLGGISVQKSDIGSHAGEALAHQVMLSKKNAVSPWAIAHELAHAWDGNYGWKLSRALERYTKGFTSRLWRHVTRWIGAWDVGPQGPEKIPGRYGRRPGCNAAGYFYGDKPSGSNWRFDRREDFAEAICMYIGWGRENVLADHARKRIVRYVNSKNGEKDEFGVADNWEDYARYFYPEGGDYTNTKRWRFVDDLVKGKIEIR